MKASWWMTKQREHFLWVMVLLYVMGRICHMYAGWLPTLLIVVLHVVPPALFAVAHGSVLYRAKGISIFAVFCLGIGSLAESVSLRTGFPFGRYYFTDVMGPKILGLPILLALAYLGIGYVAWVLAILILGCVDSPLRGVRVVAMPLLASFIMLAWDLSMDPSWSLLDRAWVWQDGGAYFGVPISNFIGWYLTGYLYYQAFALYCSSRSIIVPRGRTSWWLPAISIYGVCALGSLLILWRPGAPRVVSDATGRQWITGEIIEWCVIVSLAVMVPLALVAWWRMQRLAGFRLS